MLFCKIMSLVAALVAVAILVLWRRLGEHSERMKLLVRWVVTSLVTAALGWALIPAMLTGEVSQVGMVVGAGLVLAWVWAPVIGSRVGRFFASFYTGDDASPPAPEALYSPAIAQRNKGHYQEAVRLIREELVRKPDDFRGRMLLAEIMAENLDDLYEARCIVLNLVQNPKTSPAMAAGALNSLADWHLSLGKDPDSAREVLEQLVTRFPDSPVALQAQQRLAHLTTSEQLMEKDHRKPIKVVVGERNRGLRKINPADLVKTKSPEEAAQELVTHLEAHPMDLEAREHLARLYADEFHQMDMAAGQMEQMIACPSASPRQITQWLNELAELHIRAAADPAAAEAALQRIIALYPGSPMAIQAQSRIMTLANEMRMHHDATSVKLGTYEQRLGLKMKPPTRR
jgi:tetratricopeptide (TPR) repeat protein